ncbi:MAG: hypothetical protein R2774_15520 [Saprospiraceae bacterium]
MQEYNTTLIGSHLSIHIKFYTHTIPSGLFGNLDILTPKGYNVYSNVLQEYNTTLIGSHLSIHIKFYTHTIPSGLFGNLDILTLKGYNVYSNVLQEYNDPDRVAPIYSHKILYTYHPIGIVWKYRYSYPERVQCI